MTHLKKKMALIFSGNEMEMCYATLILMSNSNAIFKCKKFVHKGTGGAIFDFIWLFVTYFNYFLNRTSWRLIFARGWHEIPRELLLRKLNKMLHNVFLLRPAAKETLVYWLLRFFYFKYDPLIVYTNNYFGSWSYIDLIWIFKTCIIDLIG